MKTKIIQHQENSEFGYFDKDRTVIHESCDSCNSKQSRIEELEKLVREIVKIKNKPVLDSFRIMLLKNEIEKAEKLLDKN